MRNKAKSKISAIFSVAKKLPIFSLDDLASLETNKTYLKILLSRYKKSGKVLRLKKGIYVAKEYTDELEKSGRISDYLEFLSGTLYPSSYLSLDYILYENNLLSEIPRNFTSVTKNKTANFSNKLGSFFYHKIKDSLFCGFEIVKKSGFTILRASKTKALFDFLYLRKNFLTGKRAFKELRINTESLTKKDLKELEKYVKKEGSKKMAEIFNYLK